jgi:hypothetical protein
MEGPSLASRVYDANLVEAFIKGKAFTVLQLSEKENLQRSTVPDKVVALDQKPSLELTTGLQSHRQEPMIEGSTT